MSGFTTQDAGREWFGAVCQTSSTNNVTRLNFSSTMQRQFAGEPASSSPLSLSCAVLIAQDTKFAVLVPAQPVRAKQSWESVIAGANRAPVRDSSPDEAINLLHWLDLRLNDNTHHFHVTAVSTALSLRRHIFMTQ